jgi:flagellar biosynthesis component FlhA
MKLFTISIFFVLASSGFALAQGIPVRNYSNFPGIIETLKELAKKNGKSKQNTFYISDVRKDGYREIAYAYWKQDNSVIILNLSLEKETANYYWLYSKARIDLSRDVVLTKDDIAGSSFLVDRVWAKKNLSRCEEGYKLLISSTNKKNGTGRFTSKIRRNKS